MEMSYRQRSATYTAETIHTTTYTGLVKKRVKILSIDAACYPTRKILSILGQLHVAMTVKDVRMNDSEVARFIVSRRRGGDTLWHGGKIEKWYVGKCRRSSYLSKKGWACG